MGRVGRDELRRFPQVFQTASDPMPKLETYRTAIYVSASCWGLLPNETAPTMGEQLMRCRQYIREHEDLKEYMVFENPNEEQSDPDSKQMLYSLLDAAEAREFDTILVNNMSHIDESCAIASNHLARFLYPAGIRFISVEDAFDSKVDDTQEYIKGKTRAFTSYVGTLRHLKRFEEGRINRYAVPYGYVFDPEKAPHIFVDEVTAPYVRMLFDMQLQGMKPVEMSRVMNEIGAVAPVLRRNELYGTVLKESPVWRNTAVKNILKNPIYTGDYVTGRTKERLIDGVCYANPVDEENWLVSKNHHEPLVSREDFRLAQEIADGRRFENGMDRTRYYNPLRVMIKCRHCGSFMSRNLAGTDHSICPDTTVYYCDSGRYDTENGCKTFSVPEETIIKQLHDSLVREEKKAKQFLERRKALVTSELFQSWFREIGQSRPALHDAIRELISDGRSTNELYAQLDSITEAENHLMELFSEKNPWALLFSTLEEWNALIHDKKKVRAFLDIINVGRAGSIECHFQMENIRLELEKYHLKLIEKGEAGLWEDETEQ